MAHNQPSINYYGDTPLSLELKGTALAFYNFVLSTMSTASTYKVQNIGNAIIEISIIKNSYGDSNGTINITVPELDKESELILTCCSFNVGNDGRMIYPTAFKPMQLGGLIAAPENYDNLTLPYPMHRARNHYWADVKHTVAVSWDNITLADSSKRAKIAMNGAETDNSFGNGIFVVACQVINKVLYIAYSNSATEAGYCYNLVLSRCHYQIVDRKLVITEFFSKEFYNSSSGQTGLSGYGRFLGFQVDNSIFFGEYPSPSNFSLHLYTGLDSLGNTGLYCFRFLEDYSGAYGGNVGYSAVNSSLQTVRDAYLIDDCLVVHYVQFDHEEVLTDRFIRHYKNYTRVIGKNVSAETFDGNSTVEIIGTLYNMTDNYVIFRQPEINETITVSCTSSINTSTGGVVGYSPLFNWNKNFGNSLYFVGNGLTPSYGVSSGKVVTSMTMTSNRLGVIGRNDTIYELSDFARVKDVLLVTFREEKNSAHADEFTIAYDLKKQQESVVSAKRELSVTRIKRWK